ncbi:MAG: hypothetical protein JSS43_15230 [Proteobacteria bacterium]|nr:hypothetical protein [Pseudomonadota bacterium]
MSTNNPLKIAPPPPRRSEVAVSAVETDAASTPPPSAPTPVRAVARKPARKFDQVKEEERVQFNKRVSRRVADGFEMLAIRTRRKVPDLLAEALEVLENQYGKV